MAENDTSRALVKPLTPHFGAEIQGVELAEQLDDADVAEIRGALLRYYTFERTPESDAPGAKPEAAAWTWDVNNVHHNLGLQGPPTISDFKAAVRAHLAAGG